MRYLYFEYGKHQKGYSEADYKSIVEQTAGVKLDDFFNTYVYAANSYDEGLRDALHHIGCELKTGASKKYHERFLGFKVAEEGGSTKITSIYPDSIADVAQLSAGDEIVAVNNNQIKGNLPNGAAGFERMCRYFYDEKITLTVSSNGVNRKTSLAPSKEEFYKIYFIEKNPEATEEQKNSFRLWSKRAF